MGILDTQSQVELETAALEVLSSAPVRSAIDEVTQIYRADELGSTRSGAATLPDAARAIGLAAVQYVVTQDLSRPRLMWVVNAPHRWHGLEVPGSGYGIDNPDNVHRHTDIAPRAEYEITGRIHDTGPQQQSFILYAEPHGTARMNQEGAAVVDVLVSERMEVRDDGTFTVTIGPDAADGRANHLCTHGRARFLTVRDALGDWAAQRPVALEIRQTGGPAQPRLGDDELAGRTAALLPTLARFWLDYNSGYIYTRPRNSFLPPRPRPFGASTVAPFELGDDECLLFTVDPLGAGYVGCQLADPWGVAPQYVEATGSLNNNQVKSNEDGTITYVIAASDPGVWNWLNTQGLDRGMAAIRWQALPSGTDTQAAVLDTRILKIAELPGVVRPELLVDGAGRAHQLRQRAEDYSRRLG